MKNKRKKQLRKDLRIIRSSLFFNAEWYCKTYPDVKESGMKPELHYVLFGWKEGRNPSPNFLTRDYLNSNPDVKEAGMNPLIHYERFGRHEGRIIKGLPVRSQYEFSFMQKLTFKWERWLGTKKHKTEIERNKGARILVCLHLFYMESWPLLAEYLSNLNPYSVDYIVTYTDSHYDEATLTKVMEFNPRIKLIKYPNAGFDVGSFVSVLNNVDLNQYDIVFKLHSKGISRPFIYIYDQIFKKSDWFFNLWDGVLSGLNVHLTIDKLRNGDKVGLVAAKNLIIKDPIHKQHFTNVLAEKIGVKINKEYHYVAGTCFAIKAHLLKPIQELGLSINDFEGTRRGFFSLAHGMERLICACVEPAGYAMQGNPTRNHTYASELEECRQYSALRMLLDKRFKLDYEFFYKALETTKVISYDVIDIKLGDIRRQWRRKFIPLSETHPFKYLEGDIAQYEQYTEENKKVFGYSMSIERFENLKKSLDKGFDPMFMPVLDSNYCLRDGQHRACILLKKYGSDHVIKAIRIQTAPWDKSVRHQKTVTKKSLFISRAQKIKEEKIKAEIEMIQRSDIFDGDWYTDSYPEVALSGMTPAEHFVRIGAGKGYSPSIFFDSEFYLRQYTDVAKKGCNPLIHYLTHGEKENRKPYIHFDVKKFKKKHNLGEGNALEFFVRYVRDNFDEKFYREFYQVKEKPLLHYIKTGYLSNIPSKKILLQQNVDSIKEMYFDLTDQAKSEFYHSKYADSILLLSGVQQTNGVYVWRINFLQEYLVQHGINNVYAECIDAPSENFFNILTSCRCVIYTSPKVGALHGQLIGEIKRQNKKLIIDIDDLFDSAYAKYFGAVKSGIREIDEVEHIILQTEYTFNYPDAIMVSTDSLAENMAKYGKPVFVRRNAISPRHLKPLKKKPLKDKFSILLASGTATHNYDISTIYLDLLNFLKKHPEVDINVLGKANADFSALPNSQKRLELLPYDEMLEVFAENDLLIVPLEKNPFNDAKSNIKFIEAACGMTPVLARNCREFMIIQDGVTGFLYDDNFFEKLEYIYNNRADLPEIGFAARQYVEKHLTTACDSCPALIKFINS